MIDHIVRQGECLASIAAHCGVSPESLWDHPENSELRERRDSPHMLSPGDILRLPDGAAPGENVQPGGSHELGTEVAEVQLAMTLLAQPTDEEADDSEPEPLAGTPYRLEIAGHMITGSTDGDGNLEETVPARANMARLVLDPDSDDERVLNVLIGHLDPADEASGVRQRLANLGWWGQDEDGDVIAAFQHAQGLEPSGELDDATKQKLLELSGC